MDKGIEEKECVPSNPGIIIEATLRTQEEAFEYLNSQESVKRLMRNLADL